MAISGKYGKLTIPNIDDNEPIFILRAQDSVILASGCFARLPNCRISPERSKRIRAVVRQ
jgi:hypothetical protein